MPRFYCPAPLATDATLDLPPGAARHVQVLRLQPGDSITLFNSGFGAPPELATGDSFEATIERMGRSDVVVRVGARQPAANAPLRPVHLAVGMPANDRMDWLVEKATELGVASIQPLLTERSVLRLSGERAEKKINHWRGVAIAACEQSGHNLVPPVFDMSTLSDWLKKQPGTSDTTRALLSLRPGTQRLGQLVGPLADTAPILFLSGPEGGLSAVEEDLAIGRGFAPVTLGAQVLRSETAPLAALARLLC
jgi:16S rRNA (uracil1498-N3)-methyltransferase